jgi:hypothetical protein
MLIFVREKEGKKCTEEEKKRQYNKKRDGLYIMYMDRIQCKVLITAHTLLCLGATKDNDTHCFSSSNPVPFYEVAICHL